MSTTTKKAERNKERQQSIHTLRKKTNKKNIKRRKKEREQSKDRKQK